jgi:hypothetical protein
MKILLISNVASKQKRKLSSTFAIFLLLRCKCKGAKGNETNYEGKLCEKEKSFIPRLLRVSVYFSAERREKIVFLCGVSRMEKKVHPSPRLRVKNLYRILK